MINIKIARNNDGYVTSVCIQGHANSDVCAAVSALSQSCGNELVMLKSAKMTVDEKEGLFVIQEVKKNKPAIAVVEAMVNGLESIARQNKYSVSILNLLAE